MSASRVAPRRNTQPPAVPRSNVSPKGARPSSPRHRRGVEADPDTFTILRGNHPTRDVPPQAYVLERATRPRRQALAADVGRIFTSYSPGQLRLRWEQSPTKQILAETALQTVTLNHRETAFVARSTEGDVLGAVQVRRSSLGQLRDKLEAGLANARRYRAEDLARLPQDLDESARADHIGKIDASFDGAIRRARHAYKTQKALAETTAELTIDKTQGQGTPGSHRATASLLMLTAIGWAKDHGLKTLNMEIDAGNAACIALAERFGFAWVRSEHNYSQRRYALQLDAVDHDASMNRIREADGFEPLPAFAPTGVRAASPTALSQRRLRGVERG